MSLVLHVAASPWRDHLLQVAGRTPGLVPVAKGNGYGFGLIRLAREAQRIALAENANGAPSLDTLAVGTYDELEQVAHAFMGDLLVLTPWRPFVGRVDAIAGDRVIHTVSRPEDLTALREVDPEARFVVELMTSMRRHGMSARELRKLAKTHDLSPAGGCQGVALHLPLQQGSHVGEVTRLVNDAVAAGVESRTVWVSHLTSDELDRLAKAWPEYTFRPRIGTELWLGRREALRVTATVLDVHAVERGETFGYRGRSAPKSGHLLVVCGGTAHGIGLEAPTGDLSLKSRAATLARGGLDAVGFVRSPYSIDGKQRLFAEPPHMQASMLFVPEGARVPAVGEDVDVRVRFTATQFDRVELA